MVSEQKTEKFLIRMAPTEVRMLEELADRSGLSRADVLRQLLRKEHAEVFGEAPRKRPKK